MPEQEEMRLRAYGRRAAGFAEEQGWREPHSHDALGLRGGSLRGLQAHVRARHPETGPPGIERDASWEMLYAAHRRAHGVPAGELRAGDPPADDEPAGFSEADALGGILLQLPEDLRTHGERFPSHGYACACLDDRIRQVHAAVKALAGPDPLAVQRLRYVLVVALNPERLP